MCEWFELCSRQSVIPTAFVARFAAINLFAYSQNMRRRVQRTWFLTQSYISFMIYVVCVCVCVRLAFNWMDTKINGNTNYASLVERACLILTNSKSRMPPMENAHSLAVVRNVHFINARPMRSVYGCIHNAQLWLKIHDHNTMLNPYCTIGPIENLQIPF